MIPMEAQAGGYVHAGFEHNHARLAIFMGRTAPGARKGIRAKTPYDARERRTPTDACQSRSRGAVSLYRGWDEMRNPPIPAIRRSL